MASNATFEVEIYGNTTKFENSLKGVNTAMSGLRGEAKNLREALKLDPTNTDKMAQLQKYLQTQLGLSRDKATKLKEELSTVDKSSPAGQKKWLQLTRDLGTAETQANRLEGEIRQVESAISSGSWNIEAKMDTKGVNSGIDGMKSRFRALREIAVGVFRQIGSSAVSAVGNGLRGWMSDAMDTQTAMIALKNTMNFKGNGKEFDYVSNSMQKLARETNANSEDTLKLSTTFIGLGDSAKSAVSKTEALVKANQAFGGTGENLKGVAQAYGQMAASGKVTAENINQLTDNNTALSASLKDTVMQMNPQLKQYASFNEAVSDGAVSMEMLDKAMQKAADGSGTATKTIRDTWSGFNEDLSQALLPTLEALTPVINALIDKMDGWGKGAGKAVANVVKYFQDLFQKMQENGTTLAFLEAWDNIKSAFDSIVSIIGNVINSFLGINTETTKNKTSIDNVAKSIAIFAGKFSEVTKKISDFLKKISESKTAMSVLKGSLVVLASAFAAFKVAKGILGVINAFKTIGEVAKLAMGPVKLLFGLIIGNPFVAIVVAIAAVVAGLVYFFTQTKTGKKIWADFVGFLKSAWDSVVSFFSGIGQWFTDIWNGAVDGAKGIWQGLVDWFSGIVQGIQNIWNGITTFFTTLWTTVVTGIQTAWAGVTGFFGGIFNAVKNVVANVFNAIGNFASKAWEFIKSIWNTVINFYAGIFNAVKNVVVNVFNAIGGFAGKAWEFIKSIWNTVISFYAGIFDAVRNTVANVFNALGKFASNAWNSIKNVFNGVGSFFGKVFDGAKNAVSRVFDAFGNFASNAYNSIKNTFNGIGGFFSDIFGGVKDTIDNVLGGVENTIKNIKGSIDWVSKKVGGVFKGSMVVGLPEFNLSSSGYGLSTNSVSSDNRTYNTFNVQGGAGQDVSNLARAIRREFDLGRA